jgi:uncharacterized membrane protein YbaN (DUF454 family)
MTMMGIQTRAYTYAYMLLINKESNRGTILMNVMKKVKIVLFILLGSFSFVGILGTVLPVLPGMPFFLFAAFCFGKSSKRLENWFKNTTIYKKCRRKG